ncbi:S8 family serine peptidase [Patescibacteria group bacterium]|nr:S8 family serine peptidase [Patescibacteria group bacterium]
MNNFSKKKSLGILVIVLIAIGVSVGTYIAVRPSGEYETRSRAEITANYAEGEVIVKLKATEPRIEMNSAIATVSYNLNEMPVRYGDLDESTIPGALSALDEEFDITSVEKVFKDETVKTSSLDPLGNLYNVAFDAEKPVEEVIAELESDTTVEYAEPNYAVTLEFTPDDPLYLDSFPSNVANRDPLWNPAYDYQWNLDKISIEGAWVKVGSAVVKVAYIDSGLDYTHEEFGSCTLEQVNQGNCSRILPGYNFLVNTEDAMDDNGHGTHGAGIIIASYNNGIGIAGMANPEVKLIPYKSFDKSGNGYVTHIAAAIHESVKDGARVINASFGIDTVSKTLEDAVIYAYDNDIVFVAAAGNTNSDVSRISPANITCATVENPDRDCVITVSATEENDQRAAYSNWGNAIDVSAPGGSNQPDFNILSIKGKTIDPAMSLLVVNEKYLRLSGTSMATPHVSALAAMILSKSPSLTNDQVREKIIASVDDLGDAGKDIYFGYGRINTEKSLSNLCTPSCSGKECGEDGCGGTCPPGCLNEHGTTSCEAEKCKPVCEDGWGNCDTNTANGCETDLTTKQNCGECGAVCSGEKECINGQCKVLQCTIKEDCDDENECTIDVCDAGTCIYSNFPDGSECTSCDSEGCVCKTGKCTSKSPANTCTLADISGTGTALDGKVNAFDLSVVLSNWKWRLGKGELAKRADFWGPEDTSDGSVNSYDLSKVLACFKADI